MNDGLNVTRQIQPYPAVHSITVNKAGPLMLIQDLGRARVQHLGFSDCGPMDEYSHRWANKLVDNDRHCATIEITLGQSRLMINNQCIIAIAGADCNLRLNNSTRQNLPLKNWSTHLLNKGDQLSFSIPKYGLRTYLAIKGGFQAPLTHGSRACNIQEHLGGINGSAIADDDQLYFLPHGIQQLQPYWQKPVNRFVATSLQNKTINKSTEHAIMHFIPSSFYLNLTVQQQQQFCQQQWQISKNANRMGYRLKGNPLLIKIPPLLSRATNYGSIQLPSDGQPIVLMKDRQTIGGYPILGTVIKFDLYRLGQLRPGQSLQFTTVSVADAKQLWQQLED